MIYVGIDVAKDKHDCYIKNAEGHVLAEVFTIANNQEGFDLLFQRIKSVARDLSKVKVGLEATGHYSYNILGFLLDKGLATCVLNPLHTNLFRKSLSLRKTKTDKVDARTIVATSSLKLCLLNCELCEKLEFILTFYMVYNVNSQNCFPKRTLCRNHEFLDSPLTTAYIPHPQII